MIEIKIVNKSKHPLPSYATPGSAGLDLRANIDETICLQPHERALVPTGIYLELPEGFEAQIRPRSGLALKKGLSIPNAPGTIDSDYRGEIGVILVNLSADYQYVEPGERIAQMVVARYEMVDWMEVDKLGSSNRGEGGFGSTGKE